MRKCHVSNWSKVRLRCFSHGHSLVGLSADLHTNFELGRGLALDKGKQSKCSTSVEAVEVSGSVGERARSW